MDLCGITMVFSISFFVSFLVIPNIWSAFWAAHACDHCHKPVYHNAQISLCGSNDQL